MKCISDELIQRYIDGETTPKETESIATHAATCTFCAHRIEKQRRFAEYIKKEINSWGTVSVGIPQYVVPAAPKRRPVFKIKHYVYTAAVSAACIIFMLVFLLPKSNKNNELRLIYCFEGEFDSNRTYSQQEMVFKMIDANGKIVEFN